MNTIIDDDFGDLSNIVIIHDEILEETINPLIDDDFGDLSIINILNVKEEPSEITPQSNPIDPIKSAIEVTVNSSEIVFADESTGVKSDEFLGDIDKTTKLERIKSYKERIEELPLYEQAEAAINESVENPLFFAYSHSYLYTKPYDLSSAVYQSQVKKTNGKKSKEIVAMPNVTDTEYQTWREEFARYFSSKKKLNLTVQIAGIHRDAPKNIYCHWHVEQEGLPSHFPQLTRNDSCVWERYLRDNGYNVRFKLCDSGLGEVEYLNTSHERVFQIPVYGHMLQADFMGCWQPKTPFYRYFERIISGRDKSNFMSGKKRLESESDKGEMLRPRIIMIDGDGEKWAIEMLFIDTQSLHGIGKSLADIAQVTKTDIADDKNLYKREDKEVMLSQYLKIGKDDKHQINHAESNTIEYISQKERFTRYASGADLSVYQILINNVKAYWNLYTNPAIDAWKYFKIPQLTIGRSVADIIKARLLTYFEEEVLKDLNETIAIYQDYLEAGQKVPMQTNSYDEALYEAASKCVKIDKLGEPNVDKPDIIPRPLQAWIINTFCVPSSAMHLAGLSDTRRLNAKIQGGRAFRNRPLDTVIEGVIGDPDLGGAYNSMMRALDFPLCANPFTTELSLKGRNEGMSLGQFREKHKGDLIPGLYQLWVSCIKDEQNYLEPKHVVELPTPQDLIPSFHPHSAITNTTTGAEWLHKYNESYHYSHEITNGILTHWNLQIIDTVFSKQLKQGIESGKIVTSIMYRKPDKVDTIRELLDNYRYYKESNRYKIRGNKEIISRDLCRSWYGINIGDLIATPVRVMRNTFSKGTPENTFFKLIGNTVYGVLCSKYFDISNVVVANNITSGVRTGVWCMEKGLQSQNSITDGGIPDFRKVVYALPTKKLSDKNTVQVHRIDSRKLNESVRYAPIGGYKDIQWKDDVTFEWCDIKNKNQENPATKDKGGLLFTGDESVLLPRKKAVNYIDQLIYEHLATQFPKLDIWHLPFKDEDGKPQIGIMRIESKGIVKKAVCRGATDYLVEGGFHKEFKQGKVFAAVRSYRKGYGSNAQLFMEDLGNHPDAVNRSEVFEQSILLKIGLWQERYRSYFENSDFMVGDTFFLEKLIKEFSMSAFCFKNAEQRQSWKKEIQSLNQKKGQSIESLFLNDDGTVNNTKMNASFDMWIDAGYKSLSEALGKDKGEIRNTLLNQEHPEFEKLKQKKTSRRQGKRKV